MFHILVVDDDKNTRMYFQALLENSGYTAREAAEEIASAIECDVVSCVGTKFVLYKESVKKKRIEL